MDYSAAIISLSVSSTSDRQASLCRPLHAVSMPFLSGVSSLAVPWTGANSLAADCLPQPATHAGRCPQNRMRGRPDSPVKEACSSRAHRSLHYPHGFRE
jgi:hypothetical protein